MHGLLQDSPLTLRWLFERLEKVYPERQVASARAGHVVRRRRYADLARRARRLSSALDRAGIGHGERVATLSHNGDDHLEQMLGVMASGRVFHALNPRLSPWELEYIVRHAGDALVFVDEDLMPTWDAMSLPDQTPRVVRVRRPDSEATRDSASPDYEAFLESAGTDCSWAELDERAAAALCYTSGTTGRPKGVLYSHRGLVLVALAWLAADAAAVSQRDTFLPLVPFFHAQAWALPLSALFAGARTVLSGGDASPAAVSRLIAEEQVTLTCAVPTVWRDLLAALDTGAVEKDRLAPLERIICGGNAVPESMLAAFDKLGVELIQVWGMTEMSPLGTVSRVRSEVDKEAALKHRAMQGQPAPLVSIRIADEYGRQLAWDKQAAGEIQVSGPWIAEAYYDPAATDRRQDGGGFTTDETGRRWLKTGDIATIDPLATVHLVDRAKDLIKSGGEWISSVQLEQLIESHPAVASCAVIGIPHPRWEERPLALVEMRPGAKATEDELLDRVRGKLASWQVPDRLKFIDRLPRNSIGKIDKRALRERYGNGVSQCTDAAGR